MLDVPLSKALLAGVVLLAALTLAGLGGILAGAWNRKRPWKPLLVAVLAGLLLVPAEQVRRRAQGVEGCAAELRRLGAALSLYGQNYGFHYPPTLEPLVPIYFSSLPRCPVAKAENPYLEGYSRDAEGGRFTVRCRGAHHEGLGGVPADYPLYSAEWGLVTAP